MIEHASVQPSVDLIRQPRQKLDAARALRDADKVAPSATACPPPT
jgi:hypothetical protein